MELCEFCAGKWTENGRLAVWRRDLAWKCRHLFRLCHLEVRPSPRCLRTSLHETLTAHPHSILPSKTHLSFSPPPSPRPESIERNLTSGLILVLTTSSVALHGFHLCVRSLLPDSLCRQLIFLRIVCLPILCRSLTTSLVAAVSE